MIVQVPAFARPPRLYRCHNRNEFADAAEMQDGWTTDGRKATREVPVSSTMECNYTRSDLGKSDEGCTGCKWRAS